MPRRPSALAALDDPRLDRALACRAPQTKEELWWYYKHFLKVQCERCSGAKTVLDAGGRRVGCPRCGGAGEHGLHLARTTPCPGCTPPLDIAWMLWTGVPASLLIVGGRKCGKTSLLAASSHVRMKFKRRRVAHMGAQMSQADRCHAYLAGYLEAEHRRGVVFDPVTLEPTLPDAPGALPLLSRRAGKPGGGREIVLGNGARIEVLPGTVGQASGPHPDDSTLDEVDEADWDVKTRFEKTPRETWVMASTRYAVGGTVVRIERESPNIPKVTFCLWDAIEKCAYPCDAAPLPDGSTGRCPLYEETARLPDGTVGLRTLCGGDLARRADGWMPVREAIDSWLRGDPWTNGVQYLCRPPAESAGNRAYWNYSPHYNRLAHDPPIDAARPLYLAMDFNRNPMAWAFLQEAPASTEARPEFWVVDVLYMKAVNTEEACLEVERRYAPGGAMLPEDARPFGHYGGLWVVGDRSGHTRQTSARQTDYETIRGFFNQWPDYRLLTLSEENNPSREDRLLTINRLLFDALNPAHRTVLRAAPRCTEFFTEMENVLLQPGTRLKDKPAAEAIGLGHLGDALEYWAWKVFPRGRLDAIRLGAMAALGGQRASHAVQPAPGDPRLAADHPFGVNMWQEPERQDAIVGSRRAKPDW